MGTPSAKNDHICTMEHSCQVLRYSIFFIKKAWYSVGTTHVPNVPYTTRISFLITA